MKKLYPSYLPLIVCGLILTMLLDACKKDNNTKTNSDNTQVSNAAPLATLGLIEAQSTVNRGVFIGVTTGTVKNGYYVRFDTGSSALTMDADSIIPKQYITDNGFVLGGDSLVVNGITITNKTGKVAYGNATSGTTEYGNLAYAIITIGDNNGTVKTKRMPFFLYYKAVDTQTGTKYPAHENDVFGVGPETKFNGLSMASPLSYLTMPSGTTNGFKLAKFNKASFSTAGTFVTSLLTIGLVPEDLSSTSGFVMHSLTQESDGYSPNIPASITYNGTTVQGSILFDTGTPSIAIVNDPSATKSTTLPANSVVSIKTNAGYSYSYTTSSDYNLTTVEPQSITGDFRTIFSIDFFVDNQFLLDYDHHKIGLKN